MPLLARLTKKVIGGDQIHPPRDYLETQLCMAGGRLAAVTVDGRTDLLRSHVVSQPVFFS